MSDSFSVIHWHSVFSISQASAAAAAKSRQLCPTLCDPIDGSPPGSPVPGILLGSRNPLYSTEAQPHAL